MPHARTLDPSTSHQAAASVGNLTDTKRAILILLQTAMTDNEMIQRYQANAHAGFVPMASESGIRSRRAELVADGFVEDSGAREKLPSGRNAILWVKA